MADKNFGFQGDIPPGVSIKDNIEKALEYKKTHSALETLNWFRKMVAPQSQNPDGTPNWDFKMYKKIYIHLLFIVIIFNACATNQTENTILNEDKKRLSSKDLEQAQIYNKNKEYKKLLELYEEYAIKGDFFAEYGLGYIYHSGKGVEKDIKKAIEWYEKSANQGYDRAEYELGNIYHSGKDIEKDINKAIEWYEKSANQGYSKAQFRLGSLYYFAKEIKDNDKAFYWYEKAAIQGHSDAQANLGYMYEKGLGVEQDYKKFIEWLEKSANQGNPNAYFNLGIAYYNGKGVRQNHQKGLEMFKKSLNQKEKLKKVDIDRLCKEFPTVCIDTKLKF
ncbi:tetratricopeptide repeat protein [Aliarcobacter lanthieri]|uniref:tetratricopeptide repeat protein n=1 Tax=Aliarcobacter lanthieri TaxID=1355374 RepID=UPI003AACB2EA